MTETESEEHFLKYCVAYKDIRQEFMNGLENKEDEENNTKILVLRFFRIRVAA